MSNVLDDIAGTALEDTYYGFVIHTDECTVCGHVRSPCFYCHSQVVQLGDTLKEWCNTCGKNIEHTVIKLVPRKENE